MSAYGMFVAAALIVAACSGTTVADAPTTSPAPTTSAPGRDDVAELKQLADDMVPLGAPGVLAHVETQGLRPVDVTAGVADLTTRAPVDVASHFRIGSITKVFTAVVTLQLVAEGRIGLDQSVNTLIPGLLADDRVTIRMLLNHTSGLSLLPPGLSFDLVLDNPRQVFDPMKALEADKPEQPTAVAPGKRQNYSNTGYYALGAVISAVSGKPTSEVLRERIFEPLALAGTSWPNTPTLPDPHPHAYATTTPATLNQVDYTEIDPTFAGAAGAVVSTTADLAVFLRALAGARIVRPDLQALMVTPFDKFAAFHYGLGVQVVEGYCGATYFGHHGEIPGFASFAATTPDGRRQVVLMVSNAMVGLANLQHAAEKLLDRLLCPSAH